MHKILYKSVGVGASTTRFRFSLSLPQSPFDSGCFSVSLAKSSVFSRRRKTPRDAKRLVQLSPCTGEPKMHPEKQLNVFPPRSQAVDCRQRAQPAAVRNLSLPPPAKGVCPGTQAFLMSFPCGKHHRRRRDCCRVAEQPLSHLSVTAPLAQGSRKIAPHLRDKSEHLPCGCRSVQCK